MANATAKEEFKKVEGFRFAKFTDVGSVFHGVFHSIQSRKSKMKKDGMQTVWLVTALENCTGMVVGKEGELTSIITGEKYYLNESGGLSMHRLALEEGEEFMIEYIGEKDSENYKGKKFKAFELYKKN